MLSAVFIAARDLLQRECVRGRDHRRTLFVYAIALALGWWWWWWGPESAAFAGPSRQTREMVYYRIFPPVLLTKTSVVLPPVLLTQTTRYKAIGRVLIHSKHLLPSSLRQFS